MVRARILSIDDDIDLDLENLGFEKAIVPYKNSKVNENKIEVIGIDNAKEAVKVALGE